MRRVLIVVGVLVSLALALWAAWSIARETTEATPRPRAVAEASRPGNAQTRTLRSVRERAFANAHEEHVGRVVDEDGAPLSGGVVTLRCEGDSGSLGRGQMRTIGEDGRFALISCDTSLCVELNHPDHIPAQPWVIEPDPPAEVELVARPLPRLRGVVVDGDGRPVVHATVSFAPPDDAWGERVALLPTVTRSTTTDADGTFSVAVVQRPPCDPCRALTHGCDDGPLPVHTVFSVFVRARGHAATRRTWELDDVLWTDEPTRIVLDPPLPPIEGTVSDRQGLTYPRAFVLARSQARTPEQHRADVDARGSFRFGDLGEGLYDLRVLQDGEELAALTGVAPGAAVTLVGRRSAAGPDLVVRVTEGGKPVAGVSVSGGPFSGARTDERGEVRAVQVALRELRLRLRTPGAGGKSMFVPLRLEGGQTSVHTLDLQTLESAL